MSFHSDTLKKSLDALKLSLDALNANEGKVDEGTWYTLRSGVVQNFEAAYELARKILERWVSINIATDSWKTRREFYELLEKRGIIEDSNLWLSFHAARNASSHNYSENIAVAAADDAVKFYPAAIAVLEKL